MHPPPPGRRFSLSLAARVEEGIVQQFEMCRALEALADDLPSRVDTQTAMVLAERLPSTLEQCHRLEETMVFPVLMISDSGIAPVLDRLRTEHIEDEDHAYDVRDAIQALLADRNAADAEKAGYMLRCLFTPVRRHLAFDRDVVLPLYRRTCSL